MNVARLVIGVLSCGLLLGCSARVASPRAPIGPPRALARAEAPLDDESRLLGPFGAAAPSLVGDVDPAGRWLTLCQAREDTDDSGGLRVEPGLHGELFGDRMELYFFGREPGLGEPISELVASEASGDRLVLRRGRRLTLVDARTGERVELGDDVTDAPNPWLGPRAHFGGDHLVYRRAHEREARFVLRDLRTGAERVLDVPHVVGATLRDRFVVLWVVDTDTDGDGQVTAAVPITNAAPPAGCAPRARSSTWAGAVGDDARPFLARVEGGPPTPLESFVGTSALWGVIGDSVLLRRPDGALVLVASGGGDTELVPAECGAHLLAVHAPSARVLVRCARRGGALALYGPGIAREIEATERWPSEEEMPEATEVRYLGEHLVDLATASVLPLPPRERLLGLHGHRVLFRRDGLYVWADLDTGEERVLGRARPPGTQPGWHVRQYGSMVVLGPHTIDVARGRGVDTAGWFAFAADAEGRRLVLGEDGDYRYARMLTGPFFWQSPAGELERR